MEKLEMIKQYCIKQRELDIGISKTLPDDDTIQGRIDAFEIVLDEIDRINENY